MCEPVLFPPFRCTRLRAKDVRALSFLPFLCARLRAKDSASLSAFPPLVKGGQGGGPAEPSHRQRTRHSPLRTSGNDTPSSPARDGYADAVYLIDRSRQAVLPRELDASLAHPPGPPFTRGGKKRGRSRNLRIVSVPAIGPYGCPEGGSERVGRHASDIACESPSRRWRETNVFVAHV